MYSLDTVDIPAVLVKIMETTLQVAVQVQEQMEYHLQTMQVMVVMEAPASRLI